MNVIEKGLLAPGMFADITLFSPAQGEPVISVPGNLGVLQHLRRSRLRPRGHTRKPPTNDPEPEYRLAARQLDVLYRRDGVLPVCAAASEPGDLVVTSGQLKLYPSLRVAIVEDVPEYESTLQ